MRWRRGRREEEEGVGKEREKEEEEGVGMEEEEGKKG